MSVDVARPLSDLGLLKRLMFTAIKVVAHKDRALEEKDKRGYKIRNGQKRKSQ